MDDLQFDIRLRGSSQAGRWVDLKRQICPACEAPLAIHQPDVENPHRLLAHCSCEECGIWFVLVIRPDEQMTYLVRLPSVVELVEAIARQTGTRQSASRNSL